MAAEKRDFYGKEVTDAIKKACDSLKVPQESLDIEVLETGSTGIFGLIRKKARIRVSRKPKSETSDSVQKVSDDPQPSVADAEVDTPLVEQQEQESAPKRQPPKEPKVDESVAERESPAVAPEEDAEIESVEVVKNELSQLVELMGYPSDVEVVATGLNLSCEVRGDYEDELAGPDGKTLDSIQYLLRKMVARKCSQRLRISVNVGTFRERRLEDLKARAQEMAQSVKENGKTQVLPALNPSERREIHMVLQEDSEIRSRSVGDGLFKKILIYKPGKGSRGGRKKGGSRTRRGKAGANNKPSGDE